jgi:hypothetical protein
VNPDGTLLARSASVRLVFDRGTIVLHDVPSDADLSDLPGVLWDPRVRALRAPARFHATILKELERRSVQFADQVYRGADVGRTMDGAEPAPVPGFGPLVVADGG